jgi:hypothetical protein
MWDQAKAGHGASRPWHQDIARYWDSKWKDGDPHPDGLRRALEGTKRWYTGGTSQQMMDKANGPGTRPSKDDEGWMSGHKPPQKMHAYWEKDMDPDERRENSADFYKHFAVHRQIAGGPEDPMFFATDTKAFAAKDPKHFAMLHVRPKPGAQGYPVSSMSEWRTGTGDALDVHHTEHAEPRQQHEGSAGNFEPYSHLKFHTSAWEKTSGPVPAAERTESVAHMLAHYAPSDFDTWGEVRHNFNWHEPGMQSFVDDVRRNGVRRPIPVDYEQDPPQVRNGHMRLLAAERAGVTHVPTRQHEGFMDPDDPDHLGRGPDDPGHWTNQDHWNEREGAFEYRHLHEAVDEDDGDAMHELDRPDARMFPPDVYDHPEMYGAVHYDTVHAVRKARGNPEAKIRVYRALPKPHRAINKGDWVATSKDYALLHAEQSNPHENYPVIHATVRAKHLRTEGNELEEWAYHGPSTAGMLSHPGGQQGDKGGPSSQHRWTQKEFYGKGWLEEAEESRRHEGALSPEIGFQQDYHGRHRVWAADGGLPAGESGYGGSLGELHWHPQTGDITYLKTLEGHERQGIATALWHRAHAEAGSRGLAHPRHVESRTPAAEGWASSVGGEKPPLLKECQDPAWQKGLPPGAQFHPKEASADFHAVTAWGEKKPHAAAVNIAQEDTRLDHPAMTVPLPEPRWTGFSDDADHSLRHMLRRAGYPGHLAASAWVHRKPDTATASSTAWDPGDGTVGVGLHPHRWDYGTMAHEAAHLITNHQKGIPPNVMGQSLGLTDADVHDDHFARNYEHVIRTSWGDEAGDDFRRHHADARTLVSNYRARVHGLPRIDGPLQHEAVLPMPGMRNPHTGSVIEPVGSSEALESIPAVSIPASAVHQGQRIPGRQELDPRFVSADLSHHVGGDQRIELDAGLRADGDPVVRLPRPVVGAVRAPDPSGADDRPDLVHHQQVAAIDDDLQARHLALAYPGERDASLTVDDSGQPRIIGARRHEAVLPMPGYRNPHTGGDEFFHGTRAYPEELSQHGFTDPMEFDSGAFEQPDSESPGHWNSLLGTHFTADHDIAKEFALGEHSSGANDRGADAFRGEARHVLHARLGLHNPKVYDSEHDMDHEAYEHEFKAGNHPVNHVPQLDSEDEDDRYEAEEMWPETHRLHQQYGTKHPIRRDTIEGSFGYANNPHPVRTTWLNRHPDRWGIADRFRKRLQDQGHDGIVYGNEYEVSKHGREANKSAIVFDPHRVQVTQHHHAYKDHLSPAEAEHQQARMPGAGQQALPFEHAGARRKPLQPDQEECWKCGVRDSKEKFTKASPYAPVMGLAMECADTDACRERRESRHTAVFTPTERIFGPTYGLDHRLFTAGEELKPEVRQGLLERLQGVLEPVLGEDWDAVTRVYLAGSEASRWTSPELQGNNDLDVLLGVAYSYARQEAPALAGMTDAEIDRHLNGILQTRFNDEHWHPPFDPGGDYHLTGYVNHAALDIRVIKPYAAYDLTNDEWAVKPPDLPDWSPEQFPQGPAVFQEARGLISQVRAILRLPEPFKTQEASRLWDYIHEGRKQDFTETGLGWQGTGNVLEKALDQAHGGLVEKLKALKYNHQNGVYHGPLALGHGLTTQSRLGVVAQGGIRRGSAVMAEHGSVALVPDWPGSAGQVREAAGASPDVLAHFLRSGARPCLT